MLRAQHQQLRRMFAELDRAAEQDRERLCREMIEALDEHTRIEEEVFYPYLRATTGEDELFEEASVEHTAAKRLVHDVRNGPDGVHRHALIHVLGEYVGHHIREEEERIFPLAQQTGVDMEALGEELVAHEQVKRAGTSQPKSSRGKATEGGSHTAQEDRRFVEQHAKGLSRSTQRAQWIHSPHEREQHPGQTLATRNIDVIRGWAQERKARPATTPGGDAERPRVLRFDFPDYDKDLQPVSWDAWAKVFEERNLVFLFQQHKSDGRQSNFFRLDSPEREDG